MLATTENRDVEYESEFITELRGIVLSKLNNDNFCVKDLAKEVSLSRSQLHRRLKTYAGLSASCFIRETRLLRAKELLLSSNKNISEIAYSVGFASPSYFNKCFHDYFGYSPGEYKKHAKVLIPPFIHKTKAQNKKCRSKQYRRLLYFVFIIILVLILSFFLFR
ncbi:helix-turn-helix domain-containing protein [Draconibacterium sp. IB214405]|uniref:helix-turn-helix domain-containing protein n=1 Tax=Draconibacterium sp. IB214405 TaxID=3097352 RepID=UPI003FA49648